MKITTVYCDRCEREIDPKESDGVVSFAWGVERRGSFPGVFVCRQCYDDIYRYAKTKDPDNYINKIMDYCRDHMAYHLKASEVPTISTAECAKHRDMRDIYIDILCLAEEKKK